MINEKVKGSKMIGECHAHIFMNGNDYKAAVSTHRNMVSDADISNHFSEYVKRGVTYVRDGGDDLGVSLRAIQLAKQFKINYRTPIFAIHKEGHYGSIVGRAYESTEDYRYLIREVRALGGNFIKIMVSGIVDFNKQATITGETLEYNEVKELIEIAHDEGFAVMAHANGAQAVKNAARCGVDSIEHGYFVDEEAIETMAKHSVIWVPTLVTVANLLGTNRFPEESVEEIFKSHQKNINSACKKGVLIAAGSDAGAYAVNHGTGIIEEYEELKSVMPENIDGDEYLQKGLDAIISKF